MAEPRVVASPRRRRMVHARDLGLRGRPDVVAPSQRVLSEGLRALNREGVGLVSELRCECGQPTCTETLPLAAETHRGMADRFVVMPAHFDGGVVVRAADRFFVVESSG